ncbi:hypothetical protein BOX15_Mlig003015g1, partial [Macrostomum lignano]
LRELLLVSCLFFELQFLISSCLQCHGYRRPAAPGFIIPLNEVRNTAELLNLNMSLRDLHIVTQDTLSAMQWLAKYHLLANTRNCPCGTNMK